MAQLAFTADCGHIIPALPDGHIGGTGYGTDAQGKTYCYACCAERERADMVKHGKATLYLVLVPPRPESAFTRDYDVTDWTEQLRFPARLVRRHKTGGAFGAQRMDAYFRGPDGKVWHAVNRGDMDLARCRATKLKSEYVGR